MLYNNFNLPNLVSVVSASKILDGGVLDSEAVLGSAAILVFGRNFPPEKTKRR
jgi:hypothetical protein